MMNLKKLSNELSHVTKCCVFILYELLRKYFSKFDVLHLTKIISRLTVVSFTR